MPGSLAPQIAAFAGGGVVSLGASVVLVTRLERVAERLGMSEALLGLLAALAADAPEITTAAAALGQHRPSVGIGVALGSNVLNLAALVGLGALVAGRIRLHRRVALLDGAVALWMVVVTLLAVGRVVAAGVALGLALAVFVPYVVGCGLGSRVPARRPLRWLSRAFREETEDFATALRPRPGSWPDAGLAVVAVLVVVAASLTMEHAAVRLGDRWQIAGIVVGGIVLAAVTSLPNIVAGVYLATRGRGAASLSTALNSNAINVVAGLLLPATITGLGAGSRGGWIVAGGYAGLTVVVVGVSLAAGGIGRRAGGAIIAGYLGLVALLAG
ncbi:MAG TPA: hypothetical protein VNG13_10815 [Mycobacteriales bacterium]|nr:hypothetical protein [Mycobacteriales bacterium]